MAPFRRGLTKKKRTEKGNESKSNPFPVTHATRIGFGEYFHPTEYDKARYYARLEFIGKIEELAQEILVDLAQSVRPNYERLRSAMDRDELESMDAETLRNLANSDRNEFGSLLASLEAWITTHNLNAEWIRNMVLRTLFQWTGKIVVVQGRPLRFAAPISDKKSEMAEIPFSFSDYGWKITNETRKAFVARVSAEFNSHLAGYVRRVESLAEEAGWRKTPKLRSAGKDSDEFRHFEWLVRWQCQGWTTRKIARTYGLGKRRKGKSAKQSTEIPDSSDRMGQRSRYAAQSDEQRQAEYQAVYAGLQRAARLLDLPRRSGKETNEKNLSR